VTAKDNQKQILTRLISETSLADVFSDLNEICDDTALAFAKAKNHIEWSRWDWHQSTCSAAERSIRDEDRMINSKISADAVADRRAH
jgi:hypothetical protein